MPDDKKDAMVREEDIEKHGYVDRNQHEDQSNNTSSESDDEKEE